MSRVDEALRRAIQEQSNRKLAVDGSVPEPLPLDVDINQLAEEPFPIEMREHRRPRKTAAETPAAAPASASVAPVATMPVAAPLAPTPVTPGVSTPVASVAAEPVRAVVTAPTSLPQTAAPTELFDRVTHSLAEKVVIDHNMALVPREQYRRLAAILHQGQLASGMTVIMITSAVPGEGKTLTSSNLALTLSESYKRNVLMIDADLRRPALHTLFGVDNASGLSDGLAAQQDHKMAVRQLTERLAILPSGRPTRDPMAALTSDRMRRLLQEARGSFDWVIIDTPPVALLTDAHLLTSMTDGVLLVVKAGSTPYYLVKRATDAIGTDKTLGVVLNLSTTTSRAGGYDYYYSYYGSSESVEQP